MALVIDDGYNKPSTAFGWTAMACAQRRHAGWAGVDGVGGALADAGSRFAVVLQSDSVALSTWLVAPTSTSALAASFRPEIEVLGQRTRVLAEQTAAVDPQRLGEAAGRLTYEEMRNVRAALRLVLGLTR